MDTNINCYTTDQHLPSLKRSYGSYPFSFVNHYYDDFFGNLLSDNRTSSSKFLPSTNVIENENGYELHMDIPGMQKKDIKVEIEGKCLKVSGERKFSSNKENANFHLSEVQTGTFLRNFVLPTEAKVDKINAEYDQGVLILNIPKEAASKPKQLTIG